MVRRYGSISGLALLVILALLGCGFGTGGVGSWYIELTVAYSGGSRAITVTEYDVTGLAIEVTDPADEVVQVIDWTTGDGTVTYLIPVTEQGVYGISVTHMGENGGDTIEVVETASFRMVEMVITEISITPGFIGTITIDGEAEGVPLADRAARDFYSIQLRGTDFTPSGQQCEIFIYDRTYDGAAYARIDITNLDDGVTVFSRTYGNYGNFDASGTFAETITLPYNKVLRVAVSGQEFSNMSILYGAGVMASGGTYAGVYPVWETEVVVTP